MDGWDERDTLEVAGGALRELGRAPVRCPVAPGQYDRMLAAAHELALAVMAGTAAAPVIDAAACAEWLAADFARDRRRG